MNKEDIMALADRLKREIKGKVQLRVPMRKHTSFKIGGLADMMVFPTSLKDLAAAAAICQQDGIPWRVLGGGTNLLVRDGRLKEVVINLTSMPSEPKFGQDHTVDCPAGMRLARLIKLCQQEGLSGLEFGAGIPGTVGGALYMNAGAHRSTISDHLQQAQGFIPGRDIRTYPREALDFEYRRLVSPKSVVWVSASFKLTPMDSREVRETIVKYLKARRASQPLNYPSAGSVFKNPPGDHAGRLIEEAGLKGYRVGDAQISDKHANFIVNRGRARSRDVIALIDLARTQVSKMFGKDLELEIEIIGED